MKFKLTPNAKRIVNLGGADNIEDDETLRDFAESISSSDGFWYGLTAGGYISPAKIIADPKQLKTLQDAIRLVESFSELWHELVGDF